MNNELKITANNIIDKWMKYSCNFNKILIGNNYAPEILLATDCPNHLSDKFQKLLNKNNNDGFLALLNLWFELDHDNQIFVSEWLINNYKG